MPSIASSATGRATKVRGADPSLKEAQVMSQFEDSHWADAQFAQEYLDHADHYIPDRFQLFHILQSFYRTFVARPGVRCCDLGCGDGVLTEQLLREDPAMACTLVDGSAEMLAAAQ